MIRSSRSSSLCWTSQPGHRSARQQTASPADAVNTRGCISNKHRLHPGSSVSPARGVFILFLLGEDGERWGKGYDSKQTHNSSSSSNYTTGKPSLTDFLLSILLGNKITFPKRKYIEMWCLCQIQKFTVVSLIGKVFVEWLAISGPGLDSQNPKAVSYPFHLRMAHTSESHFLHLQRSESLLLW